MKRRGFLGLLGLAPAAPLIAKELVKAAEPEIHPPESFGWNGEDVPVGYDDGAAQVEFVGSCSWSCWTGTYSAVTANDWKG